ncbi:MAG TPA: sn-glycerol-3-phosphate ABC transporter substrate-binding protein UgpB [Candidatus Methylomirabilis sp.]|nr:sn-glycerol-3-phosphate ABC transporter substrate-binding protein UgpB [Candidatus Methylomirabilis sp.]
MNRRSRFQGVAVLAIGLVVAAWLSPAPASAQQKVQVEFWHGLTQPLGGILEKVVADFNSSQGKYQVNATFKGQYPETMMGAIAAFRSGNAPHIVQMFEVGTATMMAAGRAIKPVYELAKETGVNIDPKNYVGGVRGYYSTPDGKLVSMPFNSSTPVTWYNKDAFKKAGLDPEKPPRTWEETWAAAKKIVAAKAAPCGYTMAWPTWTQDENFSAIHNIPLATKANGMDGMDAELKINSPLHVKHLQNMMDLLKEGVFKYGGRDGAADALFPSGECAIFHGSSGMRARVVREAKFQWGVTMLPYYKGTPGAPKNSIIGGASFWVMTSPKRTSEEYKAVAEFFSYISRPEVDAKWHMDTGYVPITLEGFALASGQGYYIKNPGADIPFRQLTLTEPTENSRGLRLGNMPEIRVIIQEEMEKAFQGQQTAKLALDNAVKRGNAVLRNFERTNKQ